MNQQSFILTVGKDQDNGYSIRGIEKYETRSSGMWRSKNIIWNATYWIYVDVCHKFLEGRPECVISQDLVNDIRRSSAPVLMRQQPQ